MKHFIVEITFIVPWENVEPVVPSHRAFLQIGYDRGWLLCSGPQVPRTGGIVVGRAPSRSEMENYLADDPYRLNHVATHRFIEFDPVKRQPLVEDWVTTE